MVTWPFPANCLLILVIACITQACYDTLVHTYSGILGGVVVNRKMQSVRYLGIPYAKPPVNELRFKKPQPLEGMRNILLANRMPPACIQYVNDDSIVPWYDAEDGKDEDCLYLNIWVPLDKNGFRPARGSTPVMIWIYGGGFTVGSNRMYDGHELATQGQVILVTMNYRMGAFGFLNSGTDDAPGNVGLYDILEAIKWVNINIDAFGGNKDQVTLFGESAGSIAIGLLCVLPLARGLFQRVIMQSGSPAYLIAENTTKNIELSNRLAEAVGCANYHVHIQNHPEEVVRCLRSKNAMELAKTINSFSPDVPRSFLPNYGDELLPMNAREALIEGEFSKVDVFIGNVKDEGSFQITTTNRDIFGFRGEKDPVLSWTDAEKLMRKVFKDVPDNGNIIEHYLSSVPENNHTEIRKQLYTASGDYSLLCPTTYFAEVYNEFGNRVYYYYFAHRSQKTPWAEWMGSVHFDEVPFVFGVPITETHYSEEEKALSRSMIYLWTNFAKTGIPARGWPKYRRRSPRTVVLDAELNIPLDPADEQFGRLVNASYARGPHRENCKFFRGRFGFY